MILKYSSIQQQINIVPETICTLVLEDSDTFTRVISDLNNQIAGMSGDFTLYNDNRDVPLGKYIDLIINPFNTDVNERKIINKIYERLETLAISESVINKTNYIEAEIIKYLQEIDFYFSEPIEFDLDINLSALFKAVNVSIEQSGTLVEKLDRYMRLVNEFCSIEIFAFANLKSFLNVDDIINLHKSAIYNGYSILLLENVVRMRIDASETVLIIDKDLCEI